MGDQERIATSVPQAETTTRKQAHRWNGRNSRNSTPYVTARAVVAVSLGTWAHNARHHVQARQIKRYAVADVPARESRAARGEADGTGPPGSAGTSGRRIDLPISGRGVSNDGAANGSAFMLLASSSGSPAPARLSHAKGYPMPFPESHQSLAPRPRESRPGLA